MDRNRLTLTAKSLAEADGIARDSVGLLLQCPLQG
ncbi:hypothetical protein SPURM210S_00252 [Streptomyces purpurascens]